MPRGIILQHQWRIMLVMMSPYVARAFLSLVLAASVVSATHTFFLFVHADTNPSGTRAATAADLGWMTAAGIKDAKVGMLVDPNDPHIGEAVGKVKEDIRKNSLCAAKGTSDDYGGAGPDGTVSGLNPQFAVCLQKFIAFAKQQGKTVCLNEGYRTVAKQNEYAARYKRGGNIACTQGASCEHPSGRAADLNPSNKGDYPWMWKNACQFGLDFYLRSGDNPHVVPLSWSRQRKKETCPGGDTPSCADANFKPQDIGGSADDFPQASNVPQSVGQAYAASQGAPAGQPQPSRPGSTQTGQYFNQPAQTGTSPTSVGTPTSGGGTTGGGGTSGVIDTSYDAPLNTGSDKPSIADQLLNIAYGTSSVATSTSIATSVPLTIDDTDITRLGEPQKTSSSSFPFSDGVIPLYPQNTFMAQGMSWQKNFSGSASQGQFLAILQALKDVLLRILASLKPMGITNVIKNNVSETEVLN